MPPALSHFQEHEAASTSSVFIYRTRTGHSRHAYMDDTLIQIIGQIYSDSGTLNFTSILLVQSAFGNTCMY